MKPLLELLESLFTEKGWAVETRGTIEASGLSFDLIAENDTAIVFAKMLDAADVPSSIEELSSQVAALTLAQVSAKSWEAYLVLGVSNVAEGDLQSLQEVQRDLNYCRKIIIVMEDILLAENPMATAKERLSFLFPLDLVEGGYLPDVRTMLVKKLAGHGVAEDLARDLVSGFDQPDCRCLERLGVQHMET